MTFSLLIPKNLNSNYSIIHILHKEEKWIWKRRYFTKESHLRNKAGESKLNQQEDMFNDQNYC